MGVSNLFKKEKKYIDKKEYDKSNIGEEDNNDIIKNIASIADDILDKCSSDNEENEDED